MFTIKFLIALILCFGTYVRADDDALMACMELMKPEYEDAKCCESLKTLDKLDEEINGCSNGSSDELCANIECTLKKQGLLNDDMIDNEEAMAFLDAIIKEYPNEKNVIERVKEECLDEQYAEYAPDEDCVALKFYVCLYTNIMVECRSWKDTKACKEASNLAKKCKEEN